MVEEARCGIWGGRIGFMGDLVSVVVCFFVQDRGSVG
jgi:hypothetical protein